MSRRARPARRRGQATVEVVALVPLLLLGGAGAFEGLAAGAAAELADHAAEAGAVAIAEGSDPAAAARAAVPGWTRARLAVRVRGTRVEVRMRPPAPSRTLEDLLTARAVATAGRAGS
jgi:Flp pilus assembly protein TadG